MSENANVKSEKENRKVQNIICPDCGKKSPRQRCLKNGRWWIDHPLPMSEWMIPGIPQGTSCVVDEQEFRKAEEAANE